MNLMGEGGLKQGNMIYMLAPPKGTPPGNHNVPVELRIGIQGFTSIYARSYMYLSIVIVEGGPQPAEGLITNLIGGFIGIMVAVGIIYTLWKLD